MSNTWQLKLPMAFNGLITELVYDLNVVPLVEEYLHYFISFRGLN